MKIRPFFMLLLSAIVFTVLATSLVPFGVVEAQPVPVLQGESPCCGFFPGANHVKITGYNFGDLASYKAFIELTTGEKFEVQIGTIRATTFELTYIPDVYTGYNVTAKNAQHRARIQDLKSFYVQKGNTVSNKLYLNTRSLYPIIDQFAKTTVCPGDMIAVNGGNWDQSQITKYVAIFHLPNGKQKRVWVLSPPVAVPLYPSFPQVPHFWNITLYNGLFTLKVPDVFSGNSPADQDAIENGPVTISIYGPGTYESNEIELSIQTRSSIPNPYKVHLGPDWGKDNNLQRSESYTAITGIVLPGHREATITGVTNTSFWPNPVQLLYKPRNELKPNIGPVTITKDGTTHAFDGQNINAIWEVYGGPWSDKGHVEYTLSIDISWEKKK